MLLFDRFASSRKLIVRPNHNYFNYYFCCRFSDSFEEGFDAHHISTLHLGEGDSILEVARSSSTPNNSVHNDPPADFKDQGIQELPSDRQLSDSELSIVGSESRYQHVNSLCSSPQPEQVKPQIVGKSFVSSTHYLKDKFPGPRGAFNKSTYYIRPSSNPNNNLAERYLGVKVNTDGKKPITPFEKKYSHLVIARNTLPRSRSQSANSIRKLDKNSPEHRAMSGYSYGGDMFTLTSASMSRAQEKEELQKLNDRFSQYIRKVRQLGQQSGSLDASTFIKSTRVLEEEVQHLKEMYEKEIEHLRYVYQ